MLATLCTFVECSGPHGPDTPNLAEELIVFAWPLRASPFPEVRRGVLLAVACCLMFMGADRLLAPSRLGGPAMQMLLDWMVLVRQSDPDDECRRFADILAGPRPGKQDKEQAAARGLIQHIA